MSEPDYRRRRREKTEKDQKSAEREHDKAAEQSYVEQIISAIRGVIQNLSRQHDEDDSEKEWERTWRKLEVFGLWFAAGVGLLAVIISSCDSHRQLHEAHISLIASERAFVFVREFQAVSLKDGEMKVFPVWENRGSTQTRGLRLDTICGSDEKAVVAALFDDPHVTYQYIDGFGGTLGPKDTAPWRRNACKFPTSEIERINSGKERRYIGVIAAYFDALSQSPMSGKYRYVTLRCAQITKIEDGAPDNILVDTRACRIVGSNCADEDCKEWAVELKRRGIIRSYGQALKNEGPEDKD